MSPCTVAALCAAVGGKLPDDNFYYTEPSVLRKVMAAIRNSAK